MISADIIIVGAGAAGVFAAFQLRGHRVLVLDVGHGPDGPALSGNLFDLRKGRGIDSARLADELLGPKFESLHNVFHSYLTPKLKAPRMRFVTRDADRLSPVDAQGFSAALSFAKGGLANAWGAGLYRFTTSDFADFPIGLTDLEPYYDVITEKVGISGTDDDLSRFFGSARALQPPVRINANSRRLLAGYARHRKAVNRKGLYIGRPRLAVLTRNHDGRRAYSYEGLEFFRPHDPAVYTPAHTLDQMIGRGEISYRSKTLVEYYVENDTGVTVFGRDVGSGSSVTAVAKRLILAAGALNTAKLVLRSRHDCSSSLPLLDNSISYLPLVDPWGIGAPLEKEMYSGAQLNAVYAPGSGDTMQMTLYGVAGALRSDYLVDFPLSLRGDIAAAKYLSPALTLVQMFYPDRPRSANRLRLSPEGRLVLHYERQLMGEVESQLIPIFRRLGYLGSVALCRYLEPGNSFHYAGALPMVKSPTGPYQTDREGRLWGTRAVYVADAASFPALPAKNHSFTMMANAMRVAAHVERNLA